MAAFPQLLLSHNGFHGPHGISIAASGKFALVANSGGNNIGRIDLTIATHEVAFPHEVTFPYDGFRRPRGVSISPDETYALVANWGCGNVGRIDLLTGEVTFPFNGFNSPWGVAIAADGTFALVTNAATSIVSRIDLVANEVTFQFASFKNPSGVAIAPDATFALVAHSNNVGRIDLLTKEITIWSAGCEKPRDVAIAPDGTFALITSSIGDKVGRMSLVGDNLGDNVPTYPYSGFHFPQGVAIGPDGTSALVANKATSVGRIDGNISAGYNTGGIWQGEWRSESDFRTLVRELWAAEWGDGFVHAVTSDDVRHTPPALLPHAAVPQISGAAMERLRAARVAACMAPGCKPRKFGLLTKRHYCTLCGCTVCNKCSSKSTPNGGFGPRRCYSCQRLVALPRWSAAQSSRYGSAVKAEADRVPLVVQTMAGDRFVVAGGSGWATAVDLRKFVVQAVPALLELGKVEQLTLMVGSEVVDPNFSTSETRNLICRGELPAELVVVFGANGGGRG
jgi:DNA-binding beta-propeller fold protein YncE